MKTPFHMPGVLKDSSSKARASQYACVFSVLVGILMLGISEGIGEM